MRTVTGNSLKKSIKKERKWFPGLISLPSCSKYFWVYSYELVMHFLCTDMDNIIWTLNVL